MKLALIGDVHQEDIALEMILDDIKSKKLDAVWCVGDLAHGEGDFFRTVELLMQHEVTTVLGNHDRWFLHEEGGDLQERSKVRNIDDIYAYLLCLPTSVCTETSRGSIVLAHGVGDDDMTPVRFESSLDELKKHEELQRLIGEKHYGVVGGHVHQVFSRRVGDMVLVNPGTLKRSYFPGYLTWDIAREECENFVLTGEGILSIKRWSTDDDVRVQNRRLNAGSPPRR